MKPAKDQKLSGQPPRCRSKMLSFRVTLDQLRDLQDEASRRRINMSDLLRAALESLIEHRGGD